MATMTTCPICSAELFGVGNETGGIIWVCPDCNYDSQEWLGTRIEEMTLSEEDSEVRHNEDDSFYSVHCPICHSTIATYAPGSYPIDMLVSAFCGNCGVNVRIVGMNSEHQWYTGATSFREVLKVVVFWMKHRKKVGKPPF